MKIEPFPAGGSASLLVEPKLAEFQMERLE